MKSKYPCSAELVSPVCMADQAAGSKDFAVSVNQAFLGLVSFQRHPEANMLQGKNACA